MDFHNFYPIYVFKDKESNADIPTDLPCLSDLEKSKSTSGSKGTDDTVL